MAFSLSGMIVSHVSIETVEDYPVRREPHRAAHLERLVALPARGLRGAGLMAFGGFFADGQTLCVMRSADPAPAIARLEETHFWTAGSLRGRPLLHVL